MKTRILCLILTISMLIAVVPPMNIFSADGDKPQVEILDYELNGNQFTISAQMTLSGGAVECYGFAYSINGKTTEYDLTYDTIGKWEEFTTTITVYPGDTIWFEAIVRNEYGLEGKDDQSFAVPEDEPEIELDTPNITSPDEDDTFFAGDDITFRWGSVSDAEGFEWELYESSINYVDKFIDDGTIVGTTSTKRKVKIDGDTFKVGYAYKFRVRAYCDDAHSDWESISIYISSSYVLTADPDELSFTSSGGKKSFDLSSSHSWTASVSDSWIKLSASSGSGDKSITVTVGANTGAYRVGFITIESEAGRITVDVIQAKGEEPELDVDRTTLAVTYNEDVYNIHITGNVIDWEVTDNVDWLRVSPTSGDEDGYVQVYVDANDNISTRTGTITVSGDGITRKVTVTQEGRPAIVGDINGDGEITNKDRFFLNRYLAGMAGYTNINKAVADINGDGIVSQSDADYLTNHLAGIKGYESFPEPDAPCLHTDCDAVYAGKTVFINNTIKNDGVHSYYHMWCYVCKDCGEDLGEFQGDDGAIKGASEKNVPCIYNSDGVCSCGGINTTGYTSWTAKNITDKQISVYDTPYSTDGSYGKVFVNESVKVLGSKAGRYLIEYTVTSTNAKKQGYVNANFLASASNYRLEFEFETITLPVSGRTVLLIPKNGSAFYHLYDGTTTIWQTNLLDNLTIQFENSSSVQDDGYTTLNGKVGGFGTMSAYYIENGKKIYLQTPDYYIVADSSDIYASGNINAFSDEEKEYISTALDLYFSQDDINVPYELYWSAGENFALCIEKLDDILAALLKDGTATENDYARVLSEFIDKYVKIEDSDKLTIDEADESVVDTLLTLFDVLKTIKSTVGIGQDLTEKIDDVLNLLNLSKVDSESLLQLLKNVISILNDETFKDLVKNSPELAKVFRDNGLTINKLVNKLNLIVGNKDFWKNFGDTLKKVELVGTFVDFGVSFAVTSFGTWDRHREVLIMMQNAIESIPLAERSDNYETLIKAMELLIDKYDTEFWDKIGNGLKESVPNLAVNLAKMGIGKVLGSVCPVAAGAMALLDVASFFIENFTDVGEESDVIRIRQFYLALNQGILNEFESLYNNGQTFSSIYSTVSDTVKMFLNMAIYTNDLAQDVSEYTDADKSVYKKNIEKIKTKFAIYLD